MTSSFQAAYRDNTLGLPKICPTKNLSVIDEKILRNFMQRYYQPSRMTIAAVNANHDELVQLAKKYFVNDTPSWGSNLEGVRDPDDSVAQYTGGFIRVSSFSHFSASYLYLYSLLYGEGLLGREQQIHQP